MPAAAHAPRSLPARHPLGAWPGEMRADMTAAFLDYETTGQLMHAIMRGEAPRPTAMRMHNGRQVPVWARDAVILFIANRHEIVSDAVAETESLADDI